MLSTSFNAIEGKFERFFLTLLTDGENVFNDFSNAINGWSENINACFNASNDFLNCFNSKQTTIKHTGDFSSVLEPPLHFWSQEY